MPVALSYPGVYIEEIPSGVRTITGVATSIAAFAGWAAKGPTDGATLVLSWADFERTFGGLYNQSLLGYAVNQFFANGGQKAYIVRVVQGPGGGGGATAAAAASVTLDGKLTVTAANPGQWANDYAIVTKKRTDDSTRFRLSLVNFKLAPAGITIESFENLSMHTADPRYVVNVLKAESPLVNAAIVGGATDPPADTVFTASGAVPDSAKLTGGVDGDVLAPNSAAFEGALVPASGTGGVFYLDRIDLFNLLCVPGETTPATLSTLEQFCQARRAFLIADCAQNASVTSLQNGPDGSLTGVNAINAAFYFPWLIAPDPLQQNRPREFPPCGFIAGIYARTDSSRGVWKAPAGTEASVTGASGVRTTLTNDENGVLNPLAVNCIRNFPVYGTVVWGSRTLQGNDERASDWKYLPVRRLALYIEESLYRGTQWVVFEPNDNPLWAQIRLNVGVFMHDLFRQGAFQGKTPQDAYFVKCDSETTTQSDINRGVVNIVVGFAPLKPAEFVIIQIQQIAGQLQA
jgi:phage tail sheath protein FI